MPYLRVKTGLLKGKVFEIKDDPISIGRDETETVHIVDHAASRKHAEVFKIGEMCFVRDLGSRNGTFVNDGKVDEELLRTGDKVRVGNTIFVFDDVPPGKEDESLLSEDDFTDEGVGTTYEVSLSKETTGMTRMSSGSSGESSPARLATLYQAAKVMSSEQGSQELLEKLLDLVVSATNADSAYIFIRKDATGQYLPVAMRAAERTKISRSIIQKVIEQSRSILTTDALADHRFKAKDSVILNRIHSVICAPLVSHAEIRGVLYVTTTKMGRPFTEDDLEFVTILGMQAGISLENVKSFERQKDLLMNTVRTLVAVAELRNPATQGHSERVSTYSVAIAEELKLPRKDVERIQLAALLHDVGKVAVPDGGLSSLGRLQKEAPDKLTEHVLAGEKILRNIGGMEDLIPGVKHHHEKVDGSGIPDRLKGDAIPVAARIIAVANEFDHTVASGGGDTGGLPIKEALIEMGKKAGKEYDDAAIKALLIAHRNGTLFSPKTISREEVKA